MEILQHTCSDGVTITYRSWIPENKNVVCVLHLFHGMAEHGERYNRFGRYLNSLGIALYAQDHRGHGLSISEGREGYFAKKGGWQRVVEDGKELGELIKKEHPNKKIFLFGHSMGSFLIRTLIIDSSELYSGAIISGTGSSLKAKGAAGKLLAQIRSVGPFGKRGDKLLDTLSFGAFNKPFQPANTPFDWLSRDKKEVQAYVEDPLCGFLCTSRFFVDLLEGIKIANKLSLAKKIPSDFPLLIISGANDPVGNFGKGPKKVAAMYKKAGLTDVTLRIMKGSRHELLNETNRKEVHQILGKWLLSPRTK